MKKRLSLMLVMVMVLNMNLCFEQVFSNTAAAETTIYGLPAENIAINKNAVTGAAITDPYGKAGASIVRVDVTGIINPAVDGKVVMVKGVEARYTSYNGIYQFVALVDDSVTVEDIAIADGTPVRLLYGDAQLDGVVNALDLTLLIRTLLGIRTAASDFEYIASDVSGDGQVNITDRNQLRAYFVNSILNPLPICSPESLPTPEPLTTEKPIVSIESIICSAEQSTTDLIYVPIRTTGFISDVTDVQVEVAFDNTKLVFDKTGGIGNVPTSDGLVPAWTTLNDTGEANANLSGRFNALFTSTTGATYSNANVIPGTQDILTYLTFKRKEGATGTAYINIKSTVFLVEDRIEYSTTNGYIDTVGGSISFGEPAPILASEPIAEPAFINKSVLNVIISNANIGKEISGI